MTSLNFHEDFEYVPETGELLHKTNRGRGTLGQRAGHANKKGYLRIGYKGKTYRVHRVVWYMHHGKWPDKDLDHINRDKLDNRIENLREVSHRENCQNKANFNGGVYFCKGRWVALISKDYVQRRIGSYVNKEDGQKAYRKAVQELEAA